jgi:hypothetical protein
MGFNLVDNFSHTQSNLSMRDVFKQDFGLSGTFLYAFGTPISILITMVKKDFALSGTV